MADDLKLLTPDLYETDYLAWAEAQAALLRSRGAKQLDYDNLAEEIEDLGKSEFYGCQSHIELIIQHLLKLEFLPGDEPRNHWRGEIVSWRVWLEDHMSRTIENRLKTRLDRCHDRAFRVLLQAYPEMGWSAARALKQDAPYTWEEITGDGFFPERRAD